MQLSANSGRDAYATLFLLSTLTIGGSERKTIRLANHLASQGRPVTLAYLNDPRTLLSSIDPAVQVIDLQRRGVFSVKTLRLLVACIRECNVGVVIAVNLYPSIYAVMAKLFLRSKPFRVAVSINTTEFATSAEERQMLLYRWVLRRADQLIFGAALQRDIWCKRYGLRCEGNRSIVLYNGVETSYFDPQIVSAVSRDKLPKGAFVVGTVGKLRSEKAHLDFVRAVKCLRARGLDACAVIVGSGPQCAAIDAEIGQLGLREYFKIIGEVEDVRPWLAAIDVFVLSSTAETFSNSALEAMSMARPIVSTEVGGMKEMLHFGGGVTYSPGDVEGLCERLHMLLSSTETRNAMGAQGRLIAVNQFGWERMVNEFVRNILE